MALMQPLLLMAVVSCCLSSSVSTTPGVTALAEFRTWVLKTLKEVMGLWQAQGSCLSAVNSLATCVRLILADTYSEMGCSSEAVALTRLGNRQCACGVPLKLHGHGLPGKQVRSD